MFVLVEKMQFLWAFPSLSKPAYPGRYKIGFSWGSSGRNTRLACLWRRACKGSYRSIQGSTNQFSAEVNLAGPWEPLELGDALWRKVDIKARGCGGICPHSSIVMTVWGKCKCQYFLYKSCVCYNFTWPKDVCRMMHACFFYMLTLTLLLPRLTACQSWKHPGNLHSVSLIWQPVRAILHAHKPIYQSNKVFPCVLIRHMSAHASIITPRYWHSQLNASSNHWHMMDLATTEFRDTVINIHSRYYKTSSWRNN